jgi:hypothetical protein
VQGPGLKPRCRKKKEGRKEEREREGGREIPVWVTRETASHIECEVMTHIFSQRKTPTV